MAKKLLLITHDELLAAAYRARLTKAGFDVERCRIAHEGLTKARRWTPDLILLDLTLPGMHGLDVLKWLRDVPWLVTVHVVLLVERTLAREILDECLLWGAGSAVQKDTCSIEELVSHLQRVLSSAAPATPTAPPPTPTPLTADAALKNPSTAH